MERINPLIDVAFKLVFEEEDLLKEFLNSFMDLEIKKLSIGSQVKLSKETITSKESFLDLRAITDNGELINIEVQLKKDNDFEQRSVYYTSKLVTKDLNVKEDYELVPKVIGVNILNFKLFERKHFFSHYVTYDLITNDKLQRAPEYYFIEIPKIKKKELDITNNSFDRWLLFLKPEIDIKLFKEVLKMDKNIEKAEERLRYIQSDPELREKYEARFKNLTDEVNRINTAKEEGVEEERKRTVKHLLKQNKTVDEIESLLGFNPKKYM